MAAESGPGCRAVVGVVGCAAGGVEELRSRLVCPLVDRGYRVAVTLTPTASNWLGQRGELAELAHATGLPVRAEARLPDQTSPHPPLDACALVPATANSVAKLALGIADNLALTQACEVLGSRSIPMLIFPRVNAAQVGHPAFRGHIATLRAAGAHVLTGEDVWPVRPRSAQVRELPWDRIVSDVAALAVGTDTRTYRSLI